MKENKSIRIRTTINQDKFIKVHLNQTFDTLDILSLKLRQEDVYRSMCSDYGMLCGRVSTKDFGIPNAKISIFIPLSEDDENNQLITTLYPYKRTSDRDDRGIRYNLLPKEKRNSLHQPVGTFFSKREILDNDLVLEIYEKYYKFSTITNSSGDYMIFGIPIGTHTVHMDIDFSDTGMVSSRPWELIEKGYNKDLFESSSKFKRSTNLDELAQIVTENKSVEILPFWGNLEQCEVGITRTDFDIQNFEIIPSSVFFGSMYSDHVNNKIDANGDVVQPNAEIWGNIGAGACHLHPDPGVGKVFPITKLEDGSVVNLPTQNFGDNGSWGNWAFSILMNKSKKVTDEFGNTVDSSDPSKGLPTEIDVRFVIRFDANQPASDRASGYYLVPNMANNFHFLINPQLGEFYTMKWKRLYTVRQYIPRYNGNSQLKKTRRFLGIQRGNECSWSKQFPYNRINMNLTGVKFGTRVSLSTFINDDNDSNVLSTPILGGTVSSEFLNKTYEKSYDFYNNWVNGSLYGFHFNNNPFPTIGANNPIVDKVEFTENNSSNSVIGLGSFVEQPAGENFYYTSHINNNLNAFLFATNITDLGSLVENPGEFGTPNAPFLFDKLSHSSYKLADNENVGFFESSTSVNGTGISGQIVKSGTESSITRTCELGQQITIDPNTLNIIETFDDPTRKWLSENNSGGAYNSSVHRGINMKILFNSTNNGKFSYYFYFGMLGGVSNSLGLVKQKFFS